MKIISFIANGSLITDLKDTVSIMLSESMEKFREDISHVVGTEVRAEISRQTDELMEEFRFLRNIDENCLDKIKDNSEFLNETVEVINLATSETNDKLEGLQNTLVATKSEVETLSKSRVQISSLSALLQETLKVDLDYSPI